MRDKPAKRLLCLHKQTFGGQRTANGYAVSGTESSRIGEAIIPYPIAISLSSGRRACTSGHLTGNGQRTAAL